MGDDRPTLHAAAREANLAVEVLFGLIVRGQLAACYDDESGQWLIEADELSRYLTSHP